MNVPALNEWGYSFIKIIVRIDGERRNVFWKWNKLIEIKLFYSSSQQILVSECISWACDLPCRKDEVRSWDFEWESGKEI